MTTDSLFADLLKNFVFPVMTWTGVLFAFQAQAKNRKPHPMLYKVIEELVAVGTFKADNLINIGILAPEPESLISPADVLKLIRGS